MKWVFSLSFATVALHCTCIFADVFIWSPDRLLSEQRAQFPTADKACLAFALAERTSIKECFPDTVSSNLQLAENTESLSCIVWLSSREYQNLPYLIGSYASSGVPTLYDTLTSAQTLIEITSGVTKSSILLANSRFTSVRVDKDNAQTFELPSQPTFVEVQLDGLTPEVLYDIIDRVEKTFPNNYVGVLSQSRRSKRSWTVLQIEEKGVLSALSPSEVLTWEILVGIVVSLMLISILAFFLDLLSKVETPLRFQRRPFEVSKEY